MMAAATAPMRAVLLLVSNDDQAAALNAANTQLNERIAALEAAGAQIVSVATQVLHLNHMTNWHMYSTILYTGGNNDENTDRAA